MMFCPIGCRTDAADTTSGERAEEEAARHIEDELDNTPGWAMSLASWSPVERYRAWRYGKSDYWQQARLFRNCPRHRQSWFANPAQAVLFWVCACVVVFWVPVIWWFWF